MPKPKKKKTKKTTTQTRPIIYKEEKSRRCKGDKALTGDQGKQLLGWEEVTDNSYLFKDVHGNKVRCTNNNTNRPYDPALARTWQSEVLLGNWRLNGENMIIGETGQCLDCQHRLIGLVLAAQEWEQDKEKWPYWKTEPTMECFIVTGISESDKVVNTINTGKPRSLADVLYRSPYFSDLPTGERNKVARICEYAVRILWYRTAEGIDAFSPRRTHSKSIEFIDAHPKILACVRHIHDESGKGSKLSNYLSPGYAAGLLYLMASANSNPDSYGGDNPRHESQLNWDYWDSACDFWVLLAQGAKELAELSSTLGNIIDEDGGSVSEKCALVVKAWNCFSVNENLTSKRLELKYHTDEDGVRTLAELPVVGGIDVGSPQELEVKEPDPTPKEIEERKEEQRKKRSVKKTKASTKKKSNKKSKKSKKSIKQDFNLGDRVWVNDPNGDHYDGELVEVYDAGSGIGEVAQIRVASGNIHEAEISQVQADEPL